MNLWPVEHFCPPFFSRSALIWKKTGDKSVQLVRGSFLSMYFLQNPYFSLIWIPHFGKNKILEIKPCGLGSRIRDMDAESYKWFLGKNRLYYVINKSNSTFISRQNYKIENENCSRLQGMQPFNARWRYRRHTTFLFS